MFKGLALETQVWKARPKYLGSLKRAGKILREFKLEDEQKRVKNLVALWVAGNFNSSYRFTKAVDKTGWIVEKAINILRFYMNCFEIFPEGFRAWGESRPPSPKPHYRTII